MQNQFWLLLAGALLSQKSTSFFFLLFVSHVSAYMIELLSLEL